jgi:two-component system sensor histidine kinase PilS (NtrC family)
MTDFRTLRTMSQAFMNWHDAEIKDITFGAGPATLGRSPTTFTMTELGVRARFVRPTAPDAAEFVIFLEDVRAIDLKAQQLKLAAMGRLTASIAHEIRNPLAAISHAGQMLEEEAKEPLQKRLAGIVRENTRRLNGLVEDVLRVARREPLQGDEFNLAEFATAWLAEFAHDRALPEGVVVLAADTGLHVKFERSHLRQVVYNLVDNALRHASGTPGSVRLHIDRGGDPGSVVRLWVFDDGPGVAADVRAALFEPFYTTHPRGTGLGLFLAREFCMANRAELQYEAARLPSGELREGFVIRFGRVSGPRSEDHEFLDTMPAP